jgi:hypothetical protein
MRFAKRSLLIVALLFSAVVSDSHAQLKSKQLGFRVEQVRVGDQFVYSLAETRPGRKKPITKRTTMVERVVATDATYELKSGARKLIRDTTTGKSVYFIETPGVGFSMNEPSALTPLRSAGQWKTYPLVIAKGKSIKLPENEQLIDLGSSKSSTKTSGLLSILGKEKVKVGKTTYNCVKIRETIVTESRSIAIQDSNGTIKKVSLPKPRKQTSIATLWYSPELQTIVKYTTTQGKNSFTQTLTKYIKAPKQTAMRTE